jgi:hypothetical protein
MTRTLIVGALLQSAKAAIELVPWLTLAIQAFGRAVETASCIASRVGFATCSRRVFRASLSVSFRRLKCKLSLIHWSAARSLRGVRRPCAWRGRPGHRPTEAKQNDSGPPA